MLDELNAKPRTTCLARIRNPNWWRWKPEAHERGARGGHDLWRVTLRHLRVTLLPVNQNARDWYNPSMSAEKARSRRCSSLEPLLDQQSEPRGDYERSRRPTSAGGHKDPQSAGF